MNNQNKMDQYNIFHDHVEDQRNILKYRRKSFRLFQPIIIFIYILFIYSCINSLYHQYNKKYIDPSIIRNYFFLLIIISIGFALFHIIYLKDKKIFFKININTIYVPDYPPIKIKDLLSFKVDFNISFSHYIHIVIILNTKNGEKIPLLPSFIDLKVIKDIITFSKRNGIPIYNDLNFISEDNNPQESHFYSQIIKHYQNRELEKMYNALDLLDKNDSLIFLQIRLLKSWILWNYYREPSKALDLLKQKSNLKYDDYLELLSIIIKKYPRLS